MVLAVNEKQQGIRKAGSVLYFMHIPKTAGTSLRRLLAEQVFPGRLHMLYDNIGYWNAAGTRNQLTGDQVIYGHFSYGIHRLLRDPAPCYHTFLRHPVERIISLYRHLRERPGTESHNLIRDRDMTLRDFVESGCDHQTNNHMVKMLDANYGRVYRWHFHVNNWCSRRRGGPQFHQVHGRAHLRRALRNLERDFRFVGLTENFSESVAALLSACQQLPVSSGIPQDNVAEGPPLRLDPRTLAAIETANDLDLELYYSVKRDLGRYQRR